MAGPVDSSKLSLSKRAVMTFCWMTRFRVSETYYMLRDDDDDDGGVAAKVILVTVSD